MPLPRCAEALQAPRLSPPSIGVSDNKSLGSTSYTVQTSITIAALSIDEQKQWWATCAQAFCEDVIEQTGSSQNRSVLLFDTFEKANPNTQLWIVDHVLRMATPNRVAGLVIVLAGKQVPDPSGEWMRHCQTIPLQPLRLDDWLTYAILVKCSLTRGQIEQCYGKHAMNPLKMAEVIDTFSERQVI